MRCPFGLISIKAPVLGAAYGEKTKPKSADDSVSELVFPLTVLGITDYIPLKLNG
jgi:hypothetical protein